MSRTTTLSVVILSSRSWVREAGIVLKEQAVLFGPSHHSASGLKFLEAAHIKDVLAVTRWAENPKEPCVGISSGSDPAGYTARFRGVRPF